VNTEVAAEPTERRFTTDDGLVVVGDAWGDPAGPLVLLLHGGGQTRHAWSGTARALALEGHHAVALDARGHGDSDWAPTGDYALEAFARDVRSVARELDRTPAIVGASLGGLTTLILEGELAPGTSRAVVMVDVAPRLEADGAMNIHAFMTAHPDGFASLHDAAAVVAAYLPNREPRAVSAGLTKNLREGPDGRWRWHWDPEFLASGTLAAVTDVDRLRTCARRFSMPTLLVRGRMSHVVSEAGAQEFLADVPHAQFVDVSGAGHMVAGDRNDAFTAAVSQFLRESVA
jgi:non-heme chloroperoxidase